MLYVSNLILYIQNGPTNARDETKEGAQEGFYDLEKMDDIYELYDK